MEFYKKKMRNMRVDLPDEIIMEILLWLPIKSLVRFRCVSKTWLELFTIDPQFAQLYLTKSKRNNPSILAFQHENQPHDVNIVHSTAVHITRSSESGNLVTIPLEIPFSRPNGYSYLIYGIRNGLVLVKLDYGPDKEKLFIWNPLTNDYIDIPHLYLPALDHCSCHSKITALGFGCIQATNQYKVIRFCDCNKTPWEDREQLGENSHVSVYTIGSSSSWRNLKDISYYYSISQDCSAPVVNGVIHWNAYTGSSFSQDKRILSFDLKDEICGEIPHPKHINAKNYPQNFYDAVGELDGLLCMLARDSAENIQVWVMQEYGIANSWMKQFTIKRPDICGSFSTLQLIRVPQKEKPLLNTSILINTFLPLLPAFLYNPEANSVTNLTEFGLYVSEAFNYTPSLISPRVISRNGDLLAVRHKACTPSFISPGAISGVRN